MNPVTNAQVIDRLIESDHGKKIAANILREQEAERIRLKSQAEALRRERAEKRRDFADAVEVAHNRMMAARKALTAAEFEHQQAAGGQARATANYDGRIASLEKQLRATSPAVIDEFLGWLADQELEATETEITERGEKTNKISTWSGEVIRRFWSNGAGLTARITAIRKARHEANELKGRVMDADDLDTRLEELRESLPPVTMQFSHER